MATDTFSGGNTIVIDLGLDRGEPETYRSPTRGTVPRWHGPVVVAVVVLLTAVASAAPPPPALSPLLSLRVGPADSYALINGQQLLAQTVGTVRAYDLPSGQMRWQIGQKQPTFRMRTAQGLVLMRPWTTGRLQPSTTALSLTNGRTAWTREGMVATIAGSSTLLAYTPVRSTGTNRRVQGQVEALDPRTGAATWRVDIPSTAVLIGIPGTGDQGSRMLLMHDNRTAAVHDLDTGVRTATAAWPPANYGPENPTVAGGYVVLRHFGDTGPVISAYDPVSLDLVWRQPARRSYEVLNCGDLICLTGPDGVRALRPDDGSLAWSQPGWRSVEERAGMLVAYGTPSGAEPVGIVDPATGAVRTSLAGWRLVGGNAGDHLLVTRAVAAGARTMVAVAEANGRPPQPLAELPPGTGDCESAPYRLVCRSTAGELNVWAYRKKV